MSALMDLLQSTIKDSSIGEISRKLGRDERTTSNAIDSALPMLIGALTKSAAADNGEGLQRALESKHDGSIFDDVAGFVKNDDQSDGRGILGHILGQNSGAAAMLLGEQSGIGESNASSLMATLAPMVLGALGKAKSQNNLGASDLTNMLAGESESLAERTPGMMRAVSGLLDQDGDGDTDIADLLKAGKSGLSSLLR
jgi:hypothetical protein